MYERMLNKQIIPMENEINEFIGKRSVENIKLIKNGPPKSAYTRIQAPFSLPR